ncbi:hypothetical protein ACP70R_021062 [Stipagrostis hirtigluma subsp. patula]
MHSLFRRAAVAPAPAPMPMLAFPGKKPLRFACDTSAAEKDEDLAALMRTRRHAVHASESANASAGEVSAALAAYVRHIYAAEMRGKSGQQLLRFAWLDAGSGNEKKAKAKTSAAASKVQGQGQGHTSLATELAVALFALAAETARGAAAEDRRGVDGIRRACAALCDAAGALAAAAAAGRRATEPSGLCHMTDACLAALERLMLAQALECYFELAVAGGRPPELCSKIARQLSLDYLEVAVALDGLNHHQQQQQQQHPIDKSWVPHAQGKAAYFHAEACLQRARALLAQGAGAVGEAVARLRSGVSILEDAGSRTGPLRKSSSSSSATALAAVRDAAARLRKEAEAELAAAEKENCQVYYERVPAADALAALPALPHPLVQPTKLERILREADH